MIDTPTPSRRFTATLRPLFLLALMLGLAACEGDAKPGPTPAPQAREAASATPDPVDRVRPGPLPARAAIAPFGMLRVAPVVEERDGAPVLEALRHARGPAPTTADLWISPGLAGGGSSAPARVLAAPGRITVELDGDGVRAEATTSGRVALHRFTVPIGETLELRLRWRGASIGISELDPARGRRDVLGRLVTGDGTELHLAARFDRSFTASPADDGLMLRFSPAAGIVQARIALSTVDRDGARNNLGELPHWDFERAAADVRSRWVDLLGRLSVSGVERDRAAVATALYRVLARYGNLADRDDRYRAGDGAVRRTAPGSAHVGNLDLERERHALVPLLMLVAPERLDDLADTLLAHYQATGRFPERTTWGRERNPAPSGLAPALPLLAGIAARLEDDAAAARLLPPMLKGASASNGPVPWSEYLRLGYFPFDRVASGAVTRSIAASRAHHAVASVAAALGERDVAEAFATRTLFYRQLYDPESGLFRARDAGRAWRRPFAPGELTAADYLGVGPRQTLWIPATFDTDGLLTLLGGRRALARRLDATFAPEGAYDHERPEMHHVPWLYVLSNTPDQAQQTVDRLLRAAGDGRGEDGVAAAWRLFGTLGLYPLNPARGDYLLGVPRVESARLDMDGVVVLLEAPGATGREPLVAARFDDRRLPGRTVTHRRLAGGGVLSFEVGEGTGSE